jgi:hypothetical protein
VLNIEANKEKAAGLRPPPNSSNPPLSVFSLAVPRASQKDLIISEALLPVLPSTVREVAFANSNRPVSGAVIGAVASSTLLPILERMKHYYCRRSSHVRVQDLFLFFPASLERTLAQSPHDAKGFLRRNWFRCRFYWHITQPKVILLRTVI